MEKKTLDREEQKCPDEPFMDFTLKYDPWTHKALEYRLDCTKASCARPHMRAFQLAWTSFFVAFIAWFSFAPLSPAIKKTTSITSKDIGVANVTSVLTTVFARLAMGPIMDIIGPRVCQSFVLVFSAIPLYFAGLIDDGTSLAVVRGLVGIVGATFVGCQFWTSLMFEQELAGTMNAIAAGWGNLGGGVSQLVMVALYNMNLSSPTCDEECAWRQSFYIPATLLIVAAVLVMTLGDDCPKEDRYLPPYAKTSEEASVSSVAKNPQVIQLMIQYAVCFGVELHLNNTAALYFHDRFGLSLTTAGIVASTFGLMNLFARAWGGMASDYAYKNWSMKGRKYLHVIVVVLEGMSLIVFALQGTFEGAVMFMIIFSVFVQGAEGSTFGIVPYVDPSNTGGVCGFVGAGGNIGAVLWSVLFLAVPSYQDGYLYMGLVVIVIGFCGVFINVSDKEVRRMASERVQAIQELDDTLRLKTPTKNIQMEISVNRSSTKDSTIGARIGSPTDKSTTRGSNDGSVGFRTSVSSQNKFSRSTKPSTSASIRTVQ
mmetsp:Transcript_20650/g.30900  ORF Transcript_20650/g.30900 Transcript_20650/m.30900 type:complete len:541 (+) Transcript_20650:72-1694(+)